MEIENTIKNDAEDIKNTQEIENNKTNSPELVEGVIYLVSSKDKDDVGNPLLEIAQYRKERFWFFGWEVPEKSEKFESWKELAFSIKK